MQGKRFNPKNKKEKGSFRERFHHYCKTVIYHGAYNLAYRKARQLLREWGENLGEISPDQMLWEDDHSDLYAETLSVRGEDIKVHSEELANMLMRLQERKREILLMFFFLDKSLDEIAEELEVSYETVKSTKSKAIKDLRKGVGDKFGNNGKR